MKKFVKVCMWVLNLGLAAFILVGGIWFSRSVSLEMDKGMGFAAGSRVVLTDLRDQIFSMSEQAASLNGTTTEDFINSDNAGTVVVTSSPDIHDCPLGFWEAGSPKLLWRCPQNGAAGSSVQISAEYSDKEANIENLALRVSITRLGHRGKTIEDWQTIRVNMPGRCGKVYLPALRIPTELKDKRYRFEVEGYLLDSEGHKSNTESCILVDTL